MTPERWQRIDRIFKGALEHEVDGRVVFLEQACGSDNELRREVEALLSSEEQARSFMEASPSVTGLTEQASTVGSTLRHTADPFLGRLFSNYRLENQLAAGGMGVLYRATDLKLGRSVAVKVLSRELALDETARARFLREARAASALDHPNIGAIHHIEEQEGELFIVMALYEGETLKQRLQKGPLPVPEALDLLRQMVLGLEAAHRAGIVHRDVKPANVIRTSEGIVKILDFGLAKLTSELQAATMTQTGETMGTVLYMSPEQLRGQTVDGRSDLWSFGVVAYELLAGVPPFRADSSTATAMRILSEEPPALASVPGVPDWLAELVTQLLRKAPAERPQSANEVLERLDHPTSTSRPRPRPRRAVLALLTGKLLVSAAVGVAVVVGATLFYFRGRAQTLTEHDSILLADFVNTTGDAAFDGTLKQALAVKLEESPFLNMVPEERVRETLRMMGRPPEQPLDTTVAREVCQRQGVKAMVTGAIASLGSHYVIHLDAVNCRTGESLARGQTEAESKEQVLRVLGKAASQLRGKLGESLSSIQKFDVPIEATTSSLEALKAFTLGNAQHAKGDVAAAIPFFKRAVELDPNFAMAYSRMGAMYANLGEGRLYIDYRKKAFELRGRVSEGERFYLSVNYYLAIGDLEKALETCESWKQSYPRVWWPYLDEAMAYGLMGEHEKAVEQYREALKLSSPRPHPVLFANLAASYMALNRYEEAKSTLEKLEGPIRMWPLFQIAFVQGDTAAMQRQIEAATGKPLEHRMLTLQAHAEAFSGKAQKARELFNRAVKVAQTRGWKDAAALSMMEEALNEAEMGNGRRARERASAAAEMAPWSRDQWISALALARSGDVGRAQAIADGLRERYPADTVAIKVSQPCVQASIEIHQGNPAEAIQLLQTVRLYELADIGSGSSPAGGGGVAIYIRGQAHLRARAGIEAAAEFQKILDLRGLNPVSPLYALSHLGLGRAWVLAGDLAKGRRAYQDFLALWKDADADIPIFQEAKAEFAKLN